VNRCEDEDCRHEKEQHALEGAIQTLEAFQPLSAMEGGCFSARREASAISCSPLSLLIGFLESPLLRIKGAKTRTKEIQLNESAEKTTQT